MTDVPRVSFGVIVVNGEPFTRYCLRALYAFAHEIIVVEGGHDGARSVTTPQGHSIDRTLETLWEFKRNEDPEDKVHIVTRNGFWPEKDELGRCRTPQSRAYAERVSGDYLWQVDIDEFYRPEDLRAVINMLRDDPSITAVSFKTRNFWGSPKYLVDSWELRRGGGKYHRLFKWGPGYRYVTHEPPTVRDEQERDLRHINWVKADELASRGIYLYHYSLLFPRQVKQKALIYRDEKPTICSGIVQWAETNYLRIENPFRVHNLYRSPSWLERYSGDHAPEVSRMMDDIRGGRVLEELRDNDDVEALLRSRRYAIGRMWLKLLEPFDRYWHIAFVAVRKAGRGVKRCFR